VRVSLNAQQFCESGLYYAYHHEPHPTALTPSFGPGAGGTALALSGRSLDGGASHEHGALCTYQLEDVANRSAYTCRFSLSSSGGELVALRSAASWDAHAQLVRCVAPPLGGPSASGMAALHLSLNGQDFAPTALAWAVQPLPQLDAISALSPISGPHRGGYNLTLRGAGFAPPGAAPHGLTCSIGEAVAAATVVDDATLLCAAPVVGEASGAELQPQHQP
jgi:hypothetical protein